MGTYYDSYLAYGLLVPDVDGGAFEDETSWGGEPAQYVLPEGHGYIAGVFAPSGITEGVVVFPRDACVEIISSSYGLISRLEADRLDFGVTGDDVMRLEMLADEWGIAHDIGYFGVLSVG